MKRSLKNVKISLYMKKGFSGLSVWFFLVSLFFYPVFPIQVRATSVSFYETNPNFNHNLIIADSALTDYNSLSLEQIRDFLISQGGSLAAYIDPLSKLPAYWLIWQVAQEYKINPKFILTMLQKEQSLITDPSPTQNQYDWAVGYSCYGGICLEPYRGFYKQISSMANRFINHYLLDLNAPGKYLKNSSCTFTKWCVGVYKETQDYQLIFPGNKVTAALYTYNPYRGGTLVDGYKIGANYNFWKIWQAWFSETLLIRPSDTLVKTSTNDKVYLIQDGFKRPFANFSALISRYDPKKIIIVEAAELEQYPLGAEIKFSQYSLLADSTSEIFLVVDDTLKHIASPEVFKTLGFNPEEVETVADQDLAKMTKGPEITLSSAYPLPTLIQDSSTGGVYKVENGLKYPIFSKEILKVNFPGQKIISAHEAELAKYPSAEPVKFKNGTLIKAKDNAVVYFVSGGKKLPVANEQAFLSRGYNWADIIETEPGAVAAHPLGETLEAIDLSLILKGGSNKAPLENLIDQQNLLKTNEERSQSASTTPN